MEYTRPRHRFLGTECCVWIGGQVAVADQHGEICAMWPRELLGIPGGPQVISVGLIQQRTGSVLSKDSRDQRRCKGWWTSDSIVGYGCGLTRNPCDVRQPVSHLRQPRIT